MKRFKGKRGLFFLAILIIFILVAYYLVSNTPEKIEEEVGEISEAKLLLVRDLDTNYPPSPKEVLKYYSEITKLFYQEETSQEDIEALAIKSRELFDLELKSMMTEEEYIAKLLEEISTFAKQNMKISSFVISNSIDVEYFHEDGFEFARLYARYTLSQEREFSNINEVFLLKQDEEEHWKIYGWDLAKEE